LRLESADINCMEIASKYFVADLVEEVGSLPSVAAQVVSLTSSAECDMGKLTRVILSDNVMTMRFLALANSAALSRGQEIRNLRSALVRLGLRRVRNVALCMGMHDMLPGREPAGDLDMTEFWKHSLATASCAQGLAWQRGTPSSEDAWLVGILHGIGVAALDQKATDDFQKALGNARSRGRPLVDSELEILEFHHGELASRILTEWNLPHAFAETVEFLPESFSADEVGDETLLLIRTLRDAVAIVRAIGFGDCGDGDAPPGLDEVAEQVGLAEPAMEALAAKVDREVSDMSRLLGMDLPQNAFQEALQESKRQVARLGLEGFDDLLAREKLEEEMSMAREIQQRLLPAEIPDLEGFELAADNQPSLHVSGDYYDFITVKGGLTGLVIADVSGKGMPASLLASNLQASLRALARVFSDPGELLAAVNSALFESTDPERFATLFLAVLAEDRSGFRYASAGHNPPLLLRSNGQTQWLRPAGTPLGMFPEMAYPVTDVELGPDDLLVSYTDGITEATDFADVEFEESGLEAAVRAAVRESCSGIISAVITAVMSHVARAARDTVDVGPMPRVGRQVADVDAGDDLTMVLLRKTR